MPTTQVISYCVYVRSEGERNDNGRRMQAKFDAWFSVINHRQPWRDRTQVEERGGCHQEIGGILFFYYCSDKLDGMRNTIKLLPMISLIALLSFSPESIAASPTQKLSKSSDVVKSTSGSTKSRAAVNVTPESTKSSAVLNATPESTKSSAVENATPDNAKSAPDKTKSAIDPSIQELIQKGFEIFIPKGTRVPVVFDTNLSSDKNRPGDEFALSTAQDILLEKAVLMPKGTVIKGTVLDGQALIPPSSKLVVMQLRFDSLTSPAYEKINTGGGKLFVKGDAIGFVRGGKKLYWQSLFVTTPYRPTPPPDCNAFKADKGKKIEIAAGDKFDFEFSSDVRVSPR